MNTAALTIWVLMAIVPNGHFGYAVVPTLEFKTQHACEEAGRKIQDSTRGKTGTLHYPFCVELNK